VFPQKTSTESVYLPQITCLAEGGCWYKPTKTVGAGRRLNTNPLNNNNPPTSNNPPNNNDPPNTNAPNDAAGDNACYYLAQGETIPHKHRLIVHDSDPIDSFTAVWGDEQNFGMSYDVTTVTKAGLSLETSTIKGRTR